jgi:hypothetical protein
MDPFFGNVPFDDYDEDNKELARVRHYRTRFDFGPTMFELLVLEMRRQVNYF